MQKHDKNEGSEPWGNPKLLQTWHLRPTFFDFQGVQ